MSSSSSSSFFSALTQQPGRKYAMSESGSRQLNVMRSIRDEAAAEKLEKKLCDEASRLEKDEKEIQSSAQACDELDAVSPRVLIAGLR